jgi:hypothetical protein
MSVEIKAITPTTTQEPPHGSFQLGCECNDNITATMGSGSGLDDSSRNRVFDIPKPVSGRSATTQEFVPYGDVHEKAWHSGAPALETLVLPGSWGSYGTIPSKES